jgi:uncharacterized membrane protein (DUF4010 family)
MLAAARFAVMSIVILPLFPEGPFGPGPGIKPRELWMLVLLFSGMSFVGYIAQRPSGAAGYPLTGLLGGLVSSTSVTRTFARLSKAQPRQEDRLLLKAVAASTVSFRVGIAVAVLNAALLPVLALPCGSVDRCDHRGCPRWRLFRGSEADAKALEPTATAERDRNGAPVSGGPVRGVYMRAWVGDSGPLVSGFVLGLTDVDALTLSMTRVSRAAQRSRRRAITMGLSGTDDEGRIAAAIGSRRFAWQTACRRRYSRGRGRRLVAVVTCACEDGRLAVLREGDDVVRFLRALLHSRRSWAFRAL